MRGQWRLGAGALSGSGSVAGGGLIQRAARWSVRTGQSGRAVAQSRALERMGWGHKEGTTRKSEGKPGLGGEASQGLSSKTHRTGPWPCLALGRVLGSSPSGEAGTHQSAEGCETLRDPGGEWAAGERAGGPSLGLQAMGQEEVSMGVPQDWAPRAQSRMGPAVTISLGESGGTSLARRPRRGGQ